MVANLYGCEYMLSNGDLTLALQGRYTGAYGLLKLKMTYFAEMTGSRSLSIQHYSGRQILVDIF